MVDVPQIIATIIRNVPETAARIRLDEKKIITPVVCSTFEFHRMASDMGPFDEAPIKIRLAATQELKAHPLTMGTVIEVARPAVANVPDEWTKLRISARRTIAGLLVLTMKNPDE